MASTKFSQFGQASNTSETEISVGVKGGSNFKRLNKLTATTAPTVNDDGSDGYTVGSTWFDTTTGTLYVCSDSTNGAAVWVAQKAVYLSGSFNPTFTGEDATIVSITPYHDLNYIKVGDIVTVSGYLNIATDYASSAQFQMELPESIQPNSNFTNAYDVTGVIQQTNDFATATLTVLAFNDSKNIFFSLTRSDIGYFDISFYFTFSVNN